MAALDESDREKNSEGGFPRRPLKVSGEILRETATPSFRLRVNPEV